MKSTLNLSTLLSLCALFILQSCSPDLGVWKDDKIRSGIRDDMHAINKAVFEAVAENNDKKFSGYMSAEMLKNFYYNTSFSSLYAATRRDSFKLATEYYVMNKYKGADTIIDGTGKDRHIMKYEGDPQEMYIATFLPQNKTPNQNMITFYYGHYDYGWKIRDIDIAQYSINGKTAPQLYEEAKQAYAAKELFAAYNLATLAQNCSRPNLAWQYDGEAEKYAFGAKVLHDVVAGYEFPMQVSSVGSHPAIIRVDNIADNNGTYPSIIYVTKISMDDADALERENAEIRKYINKLLPGVEKHTPYVVYSAYAAYPGAKRYEMKVKGL